MPHTGNPETVAGYVAAATGAEMQDIGDMTPDSLMAFDGLICGAPTWHTGADSERSGTAWDEFLYGDLKSMDLKGKKVAIFGLGDQAGYGDNFCDGARHPALAWDLPPVGPAGAAPCTVPMPRPLAIALHPTPPPSLVRSPIAAMEELASCFKAQGAEVVGSWDVEGYEHEESKSIDGGKFIGLACDEDNQPDLSEERVNAWIAQIKGEGMPL